MKRREFLTGLTAGALASPVRATQSADAFDPARVLFIIPDVGSSTDPVTIEAALQAFVAHALPANLVIRTGGEGGPGLTPGSRIAELLRGFALRFPGLIELVAWAPDLGRRQPFQVARSAMEARSDLIAAIWGTRPGEAPSAAVVTIATDYTPDPLALAEVASAGFQNVLALPRSDTAVGARLSSGGVLTLLGGSVTRLDRAEMQIADVKGNGQALFILPVATLGRSDQVLPAPAIARLAAVVQAQELAGRMTTVLTRELQMRTDAGYRQRLALHLFDALPGEDESARAVAAFRKKLDQAQIRYSVGKPLGWAAGVWSSDEAYWIPLDRRGRRSAGTAPGPVLTRVRRTRGTDATGWQSDAPLEPGVAVVFSAGLAGACGPDDTAAVHVPVLALVGDGPFAGTSALSPADSLREGLLVIDPRAVATEAQRNLVLRALRGLADAGVADIRPLDQFVVGRLPDDRLLPAYLRTERLRAARRAQASPPQPDRQELLADAAVAWSYFAKGTSRTTGLCPSTTVGGKSATEFDSVTMWETGSQFNALSAALHLGLIDGDGFVQRTKAILKSLDRMIGNGRTLPPEWVDIQTGRSSRSFNSFDTGRLLLALDRLRAHPLAPAGIDKIVASWDFGKIIRNRRLHSIKSGTLVDDFNSNYTDYAAAGFRAWGYDVTSPFEPMHNADTTDLQMALLYAVARIGPIGAEPALLALIDSAASPSADVLADVLLAAQADAFDRTGRLLYPSESPIDRPPWFAFQGYSVDARDDPWTIKFDRQDPEFQTAEFRNATRANSSKAAYLWHALRPCDLSGRMVAKTRALARSDVGFLSAIYLEGEAPTLLYSDLNTNSVILQAIAHMI